MVHEKETWELCCFPSRTSREARSFLGVLDTYVSFGYYSVDTDYRRDFLVGRMSKKLFKEGDRVTCEAWDRMNHGRKKLGACVVVHSGRRGRWDPYWAVEIESLETKDRVTLDQNWLTKRF